MDERYAVKGTKCEKQRFGDSPPVVKINVD